MATLTGEQLKDSYQSLVTIGDSITSDPTSGVLENGKGTALTAVGIGTDSPDAVLTTVNSGALTTDSNDDDHSGFGLLIQPTTITANTVNSAIGFSSSSGRKYCAIGMQTYDDSDQNGLNFYVQPNASGSTGTLTEAMRITNIGDISFRDTSNNEAFYWDASAGSLGIGTTSPDALLHIESNGSSVIRLTDNDATVEDGSIAGKIEFENNDSSGGLNAYIAGVNEGALGNIALSFATGAGGSATERMRIDSDGNVGIGASTVDTKLHVEGVKNTSILRLTSTTNDSSWTTGDKIGGIEFESRDGSGAGAGVKGSINYIVQGSTGSSTAMTFSTASGSSNDVERMRIDSSGNVGIGTTSAPNLTNYKFLATNGATGGGLVCQKDETDKFAVYSVNDDGYYDATSNHIFRTGGALTGTEAMRIDSSGNILVGTSATPTSSAGNIVLKNGTAPTGNAADGVILYAEDVSTSSELKVRDEAGNVTTLSPHNFSLIPDGASEPMAWAYYSERDGKKINVDMLKLARMVESLTGEKLVYEQ